MLALERHREILALLEREGSARVTNLAIRFQVTEETIRRDLAKLETDGGLRRSHGGAVYDPPSVPEAPYWRREVAHEQEKALIAREAINRITPGQRIFLDASTTAWHMARQLPDLPLTVVTNSIQVAMELARLEQVDVRALGGELARRSLSFVGPLAQETVRQYHVDTLFMSCKGVDLERGASDATEAQAHLRREVMRRADRTVLMIDHSKFGVKALASIAELEAFNEIITNHPAPPDIVEALHRRAIPLTVVNTPILQTGALV